MIEKQPDEALTFDDILIKPSFSQILPSETKVSTYLTENIQLNIPFLSSAMDTVTEVNMSIAIAQEGGLGVIHKNMSIEDQAKAVWLVKKFESGVVKDPITISPDTTVSEIFELRKEYNFSGFPVVEGQKLIGIVTNRDIRFEPNLQRPVKEVMTPKERLVVVEETTNKSLIQKLMHQHRIEKILIVDKAFNLLGLVTEKDMNKSLDFPLASKDKQGRLQVAAAVGTSSDTYERVEALVQMEVDAIVVDTAHGHSKMVGDSVRWIKENHPHVAVIAGNVATEEGAVFLAEAGVDVVKVGIGPGSICTTRIITGVGVPQVYAIQSVLKGLKDYPQVSLIADGGIRYSGDIAKALAIGANAVMLGSLLAGTDEAPGDVELYQGRSYKSYRGMGSLGAMQKTHNSIDRYFQQGQERHKLVPEGIEGRVPYKGSLSSVVTQLVGGLRSSMGYVGAKDLNTFRQKSTFVKVTSAGIQESHVHDVSITKASPNYPSG